MEWIITKDHTEAPGTELCRTGRARLKRATVERLTHTPDGQFCGKPDGKPTIESKLEYAKTLPFEFRLFDDDGELYYEGKCGNLNNACDDEAFAPLDWAMADAGCTRMEYRMVGASKWEVL